MALLAIASDGRTAQAQDWPTRPIRIIVGFGAGGGTDIAARIVGQPLSEILGQPVVIENRVGAGGTIAANAVATAPTDGYTALMMSNAHVIAPVIYKTIPYDSVKDFAMISMVGTAGLVVVTHPDFPAKTLRELIGVLKASPGKYNFASPGVGTTQHFAGELISQMAGIQMTHIPFRGTPAALAALVGKQVDRVRADPAGRAEQAGCARAASPAMRSLAISRAINSKACANAAPLLALSRHRLRPRSNSPASPTWSRPRGGRRPCRP